MALTRVADDADAMTGDYIIEESDDEANGDSPFQLRLQRGNILDISGNALAGDTTIQTLTVLLLMLLIPLLRGNYSGDGHTYDASTGVPSVELT